MLRVIRFYGASWFACLIFLPLVATAQGIIVRDWKQQPERSDTVSSRERSELEPVGIPFEGYYFYPKFAYTYYHTDNVFAVGEGTESDQVSIYSPGLATVSDWTRHGFELSGSADLGRYRDFSEEDYDDWQIAANGWLDASSVSRFSGGLTRANLHETRESPDDVSGLNPTKFDVRTAYINFNHREGRFTFTPSLDFNEFDYHDVKALVLGRRVVLDQDYRDRSEYNLDIQAAYEIGYKHDVFARARFNVRDYDNPQIITGFDRSSDGYEAGAGIHFELGGISHGKLYLGYREQQFESPLPDIETPIYEILFAWNVTGLTTLPFGAERGIMETTALFDSGYVSSLMSIRIDHELRRNLFLHARV